MHTFDSLTAATRYVEKRATVTKLRYRWRAWLRADQEYGDRREYGDTRAQALDALAATLPLTDFETWGGDR